MARSIEEQVEDAYKEHLKSLGLRLFIKTESMGEQIDTALVTGESKSGGAGVNRPDIRFFLDLDDGRHIPVMVEAKGTKGRLVKEGEIKKNNDEVIKFIEREKRDKPTEDNPSGKMNWSVVQNYAVNGAVHYGRVILGNSQIDEVIVIGVNGYKRGGEVAFEHRVYWMSTDNSKMPKEMPEFRGEELSSLDGVWSLFRAGNERDLREYIDNLMMSDEEREEAKRVLETELESRVKGIHQRLYDADDTRNLLQTNEKLYLFCALIMAGLDGEGVPALSPDVLNGLQFDDDNDGERVLKQVRTFLRSRGNSSQKVDGICDILRPTLTKKAMYKRSSVTGESLVKSLFKQISEEIVPYLTTNLKLDFTGKILNSLNDWVQIENDKQNDVVLTPRQVTKLMARLARTNKDSYVWDSAMGSAGMLVAALDIMERDVRDSIPDRKGQDAKLRHIHEKQLLGIEILGNVYVLAVLNMILMGDGSSNIKNKDTHDYLKGDDDPLKDFPANVFLLNPPYSAEGKGLVFVYEAVTRMEKGYACVLIQENAGSGNGGTFAKSILGHATLRASVHMPLDLFIGKSNVQTAIYVFECGRPHEADDEVIFIDMSEDGYARQNRRKSSSDVNLRDVDHAEARYDEVVQRVLGKKAETEYYTEANGLLIRDSITLNGDDWTFAQHKVIDLTPTEEDFRKTVADYLSWRVSQVIAGGGA